MSKSAIIYERNGRLFVRTLSYTTTGAWIESGPCTVIDDDGLSIAVGEAVMAHLAKSTRGLPHPTDWKLVSEPLLRAAGARSWNVFGNSARCVHIDRAEDTLVVRPTQNERPGFVLIEDAAIQLALLREMWLEASGHFMSMVGVAVRPVAERASG